MISQGFLESLKESFGVSEMELGLAMFKVYYLKQIF